MRADCDCRRKYWRGLAEVVTAKEKSLDGASAVKYTSTWSPLAMLQSFARSIVSPDGTTAPPSGPDCWHVKTAEPLGWSTTSTLLTIVPPRTVDGVTLTVLSSGRDRAAVATKPTMKLVGEPWKIVVGPTKTSLTPPVIVGAVVVVVGAVVVVVGAVVVVVGAVVVVVGAIVVVVPTVVPVVPRGGDGGKTNGAAVVVVVAGVVVAMVTTVVVAAVVGTGGGGASRDILNLADDAEVRLRTTSLNTMVRCNRARLAPTSIRAEYLPS